MLEKKSLMFFMGGLNGGGAEKVLVDTLKSLNPQKYDITLILLEDKGLYLKDVPDYVNCRFLTHRNKPCQKIWFYRFLHHIPFKWVYRFYIPDNYDIEIAFLEGLATHVIGSSTNKKSKKYAWVHIDMMENHWSDVDFRSENQQKRIYHNFDGIFCVSKYCEYKFKERFGSDLSVSTKYNILCNDAIIDKSNEISIEIPKDKMTIVSSGRFTMQKGFDRLLRIHKRLLDNGYYHNLWLLGDGAMRSELEEYIREKELNDSVTMLGFQRNPYPYMKAADVFVCSSRAEGLSTVVTEALILGLPVVSVKCSGADELLDNGRFGILTENNEDALYEGIRTLIEDASVYDKYKKLAAERGKEFSKEQRVAELEQVFDE